jgi:hypothetical protein
LDKVADNSLIRLDASHVHLSFDFSAVSELYVKQYDPVAAHIEVDVRLVATGRRFIGCAKNRTHARVRHVGLDHDGGVGNGLPSGVGKLDGDGSRSHARGLWRDLLFDGDTRSATVCSMTAADYQYRQTGKKNKCFDK